MPTCSIKSKDCFTQLSLFYISLTNFTILSSNLLRQACRCHGYPTDTVIDSKTSYFCLLNHQELGASDLIDNVARIGEQTVLFLPSFEDCPIPQSVSTLLTFRIIERTNLASLNEGNPC